MTRMVVAVAAALVFGTAGAQVNAGGDVAGSADNAQGAGIDGPVTAFPSAKEWSSASGYAAPATRSEKESADLGGTGSSGEVSGSSGHRSDRGTGASGAAGSDKSSSGSSDSQGGSR
jgi:hypothetical protein